MKQNHCLALTGVDLLSGPREGSCFDRYLCNISDSTHDRSVDATGSKNNLFPAHVRLTVLRREYSTLFLKE